MAPGLEPDAAFVVTHHLSNRAGRQAVGGRKDRPLPGLEPHQSQAGDMPPDRPLAVSGQLGPALGEMLHLAVGRAFGLLNHRHATVPQPGIGNAVLLRAESQRHRRLHRAKSPVEAPGHIAVQHPHPKRALTIRSQAGNPRVGKASRVSSFENLEAQAVEASQSLRRAGPQVTVRRLLQGSNLPIRQPILAAPVLDMVFLGLRAPNPAGNQQKQTDKQTNHRQ